MQFLTDFADEAVILPLIFAIGATLWLLGWRRGAIAWTGVTLTTLGAMLILKLTMMACGPAHMPRLRTPSGHTAAAAVVAGSLAALIFRRERCLAAMIGAVVGAAIIGTSRYMLWAHTLSEVLVASLVGIAGAVGLAWLSGTPPPRLRLAWVAVPVVVVLVAFHGDRLRAEPRIWRAAYAISHDLGVCRGTESWRQFHTGYPWAAGRP